MKNVAMRRLRGWLYAVGAACLLWWFLDDLKSMMLGAVYRTERIVQVGSVS